MKRRKLLFFSMILATLTIGVVIGTVINRSVNAAKPAFAPGASEISVPSPTQLSSGFSKVAQTLEAAVVNINTETVVKSTPRTRRGPAPGEPFDDPFDFFERFFGGPQGPSRSMKTRSLGSGFIVDKNGYILTNSHVVNKADKIQVRLSSGEEYPAKIVGEDGGTDLAVIKIEAKEELTVAKLGNSDSMAPGDWVLAMGSPFGLEHTITAGIISATGRKEWGTPWQRFLQTDAAINQGNSGGPLVNLSGEVIGVNTAIITPTGGNAGIGFALPSNTAANVYNQIIKTGKVTRGAIGISMQADAKPQVLRALGAKDGKGVIIQKILPVGGPADKAGLKQGDVIVEVDGKKVGEASDMHAILSDIQPGTVINVKYLRDSKERSTRLTVGDRDEVLKDEATVEEEPAEDGGAIKLGITVQSLSPQQARQFDLSPDEGVLVVEVQPGSVAEDAGLLPNDVILEINKTAIRSPQDLRGIASRLRSGTDVVFLIKRWNRSSRDAGTLYLATTIP